MKTVTYGMEAAAKELFDQAKLADLASELNRRIEDDGADVRAAFKLATLAAYRGDAATAIKYFAVVGEYDWRRGLRENNLAVVYIRAGLTLAGIEKLLAVATMPDPPPAAVAFNLAVILDRIADFGSDIPPQLIDCGLVQKGGENLHAQATTYYKNALKSNSWEAGLEGALYLWPADIPPSTGFPVTLTRPSIEEAHQLLHEAITSVKNHEWCLALNQLDQAGATYPPLRDTVQGVKTVALIGLCRQLRVEVREKIKNKAFDQARDQVEDLTALYAEIPADDLIHQLLIAEVAEVGEQLRRREAVTDFSVLQRLSTAAKKAIDRLRAERTSAPPDQSEGQEEHGAAWEEADHAEQLLQTLGNSVDEQLRRLAQAARYGEAKTLVEWAKQQWFAQAIQPTWQRDIGQAKAQDHLAQARSALGQGNSVEAERELAIALHAAQEADAQAIMPLIEGELARLQAAKLLPLKVDKLQVALARGEYAQVLEQCAKVLQYNPNDETLLALRASALKLLGERAHAWARLEDWDQVEKALDIYLVHRPEDEPVQALRARAAQGRVDRLIEQAWNHWYKDDQKNAKALCMDALRRDPWHPRAVELQREMEAATQHAETARDKTSVTVRYQAAYLECQAALDKGHAELAFTKACELYRLDPRARHTEDTCKEAFGRYVDALRIELEESHTAEAFQKLGEKLRQLLAIEPTFAPALQLLVDLQREEVRRNTERIEACRAQIAEAESALKAFKPEDALTALAMVFDLGVAEFTPKAEALRDAALHMARRKLTRLIAEAEGAVTGEAEALCNAVVHCSPELQSEFLAGFERDRERIQIEPLITKDVKGILDAAIAARDRPCRALRTMDREVCALGRKYPVIPANELIRLQELRHRFLNTMPWRQRWTYAVLARLGEADRLYRTESDHHESSDHENA